MSTLHTDPNSTCWVLIQGAAAGKESERADFASRYEPVVRAYLAQRWRRSPLLRELDDAAQEVFVECFRRGGVLDRIGETVPESFRAFLYGVTRIIALRLERSTGRRGEREAPVDLDAERVIDDEPTLSRVFDRAWARSVFRQARELQEERARSAGEAAEQRVELLRLRSSENLPVRKVAELWGVDAAWLHKEYARARREFRAALIDVISFHDPHATDAEVEDKCKGLLGLMQGA